MTLYKSLAAPFREPGGDERVRTAGLLLARQALYQLSYTPTLRSRFALGCVVAFLFFPFKVQEGFPSCTLKTVQMLAKNLSRILPTPFSVNISYPSLAFKQISYTLRKEVIQPHLPIRLPCYDFTPVIGLTLDNALPKVRLLASGAPNSHGVTGGVYKARERIHRGMLIRDY